MSPTQILPNSFLYEVRKCPRCKKTKEYLKSDAHKYCEECRQYARSYKKQHRKLKLSKQDLIDMEQERQRKFRELSAKYGTASPDCITWHEQYSKGQFSDFFFNHLDSCKSCAEYYAQHKDIDKYDLNALGNKSELEELKGYNAEFNSSESSNLGENKQGWNNMTEYNDPDVYNALHPQTPEERAKKRNPLQDAIDEQKSLS